MTVETLHYIVCDFTFAFSLFTLLHVIRQKKGPH